MNRYQYLNTAAAVRGSLPLRLKNVNQCLVKVGMRLQEADFFSLFNMGQGALLPMHRRTWKKMRFVVPMYTYICTNTLTVFPMHPHNLIHSVAARLDILSHSTKLSLHGTCSNLFPVWLVGKRGLTSSFHPNLTSSLTKLGDPPNLLNLGVGSKPSKPLEIK